MKYLLIIYLAQAGGTIVCWEAAKYGVRRLFRRKKNVEPGP